MAGGDWNVQTHVPLAGQCKCLIDNEMEGCMRTRCPSVCPELRSGCRRVDQEAPTGLGFIRKRQRGRVSLTYFSGIPRPRDPGASAGLNDVMDFSLVVRKSNRRDTKPLWCPLVRCSRRRAGRTRPGRSPHRTGGSRREPSSRKGPERRTSREHDRGASCSLKALSLRHDHVARLPRRPPADADRHAPNASAVVPARGPRRSSSGGSRPRGRGRAGGCAGRPSRGRGRGPSKR